MHLPYIQTGVVNHQFFAACECFIIHPFVIPAGTYAGQGEDVWTVSVQALLLASNALSDETVQRLTARYFDSVDAVAAAVPVPLVTDPAVAAAQSVIPYHTGAAAYYTAQGITPAGPETGASPEQEAAA